MFNTLAVVQMTEWGASMVARIISSVKTMNVMSRNQWCDSRHFYATSSMSWAC
jgi:hypothetical protein